MSSEPVQEYAVAHGRAKAFYERYERKEELQHQTHFCPGCGHGTVHKMLAKAIDDLGVQDRTILVGPVGCSVFTYYYFDVGNVQAAHGRAPAVATAMKRSRPESIVISYQGDGDLSAIGSAEILHAANRGENITVIFVNNAIYSMTGGQAAPTTLLGQKSTTTPNGRNAATEGYPLHVSELLSTLEAPVYIERVGLGDNKQIAQAARAIKRALGKPGARIGLSADRSAVALPDDLEDDAGGGAALGARCDGEDLPAGRVLRPDERTAGRYGSARAIPMLRRRSTTSAHSRRCRRGSARGQRARRLRRTRKSISQVRIAGFGGQGVLLLGEVLAEAGLDAGLEVSWLPSYGPEMRSGTSNCHVRLSRQTIDSPLVTAPNVLVAMNEPSLRKFDKSVRAGGWVIYNGDEFPADCARDDVHVLAAPFTHLADELGDKRAANMVMLGALLEIAGVLPQASIDAALRRLVKNPRWVELDERALARGRELYRESLVEV